MSERMFPIMGIGYRYAEDIGKIREAGSIAVVVQIPWAMLAPHEEQAERNHSQSLKRLAERGGLGASEALAVLDGRRWTDMPLGKANAELLARALKFAGEA